ncbi:uncharacterized protein [Gossypium hirsutum]|uniref:DUF4283 domain-containing protein n=1 Tax=Gossypium hirsutum TaxID=3635 RepID=A0A1U8LXA7_GOSHI|nr:uncharacterized protein LOC107931733 [Gossypium hirsutum]
MENSINLDGISSLSEIEDGGGLRADVDRNIKKVRFKGGNNEESTDMLGPWLIYGQYLTVQPWTKEFTPSQPYPSMVLAWIRLPGLPGFLYKKRILEEIGGIIGKVVLLDFNTDSRTKGRFAWIAVYINLDNPLIAQVLVNGLHQKVEYEALPMIYFTCGKYDHTKELCVPLQPETSSGKEQTGVTPVKDMNEGEGAIYGPWMVVEKKSRCDSRNSNLSKADLRERGKLGSRFDALVNMETLKLDEARNKEIEGQTIDFRDTLKAGKFIEYLMNNIEENLFLEKEADGGS